MHTPDTYPAIYRALVTSVADPLVLGRVRAQCPQVSGAAELNWAIPINNKNPLPLVGDIIWVAFNGGDLTKPIYFTDQSYVINNGIGALVINSPYFGNDQSELFLSSGVNPYLALTDTLGTTSASFFISGVVVKTNNIGTAEVWHHASSLYKPNWVDGTGFNGLGGPVLQYRKDAEDNVWLYGMTKSNAGAGTTVFTLPANYFNPAGASGFVAASTGSGTPTLAACAIDATGNVILTNVVTGTTYQFNFRFPLGNIS
jgi:hypothetical protein